MPTVVLVTLNEAPVQQIIMEAGADFYLYRQLATPELGDIVDWSTVTDIRFQMRKRYGAPILYQSDLSSGKIMYEVDGSLITVKMTHDETMALTEDWGIYDLFVKAGADWSKVLKGNFRRSQSVIDPSLVAPVAP